MQTQQATNLDVGFFETMLQSAWRILLGLADKLPLIMMGLLFLALSWTISRLTVRVVKAAMARTSTAGHVDVLLAKLAGGAVFVIGVIVSLGIMGLQVAALVTSLGLAGITIGFALKDVLANSMAGILLLLQRPFTIGDSISVADCEGVVRDIRVRDTLLEQADGCMVFVPNATVFNAAITNNSVSTRRRVEVRVQLANGADLEAAREAALRGLEGLPGLLDQAESEAVYVKTGAASLTLAARAWVDTAEVGFGKATDAAITGVFGALQTAGVEFASAE